MEAYHAACSVIWMIVPYWAIVGETVRSEEDGNCTVGIFTDGRLGVDKARDEMYSVVSQLT